MDRNSKKAWLYLLPSLILLGAFLIYPLIDVLIYSTEEWLQLCLPDLS